MKKETISNIDSNLDKEVMDYSLKIQWASLCTICGTDPCFLRGMFPTCDCKNFKPK